MSKEKDTQYCKVCKEPMDRIWGYDEADYYWCGKCKRRFYDYK